MGHDADTNPTLTRAETSLRPTSDRQTYPPSRPAFQDDAIDRVVVSQADDVAAVLADASLSSNPFNARPTALAGMGMREEDRAQAMTMAQADGAEHARLRRLVTPALAGRAVASLRPEVERIVADLLDAIDPHAPFELVASLASPLPSMVIAALLGIESAEIANFRSWTNDLMVMLAPEKSADDIQRMIAAIGHLDAQSSREIEKRRATPSDDLIGTFVAAEDNGVGLTETEMVNNIRLLLSAGNMTTTDLIASAVVTLLDHPDALTELRGDPTLWPAAIEEVLRCHPPVNFVMRQPLEARTVGGCPVAAGQSIATMLGSANHDPLLHRVPERFDLHRAGQKHFSFGGGTHFCPGAALARMEAEVTLTALFTRFPHLRLSEDRQPEARAHPMFSGYLHVWIEASGSTS